jgi:hypothetical protein
MQMKNVQEQILDRLENQKHVQAVQINQFVQVDKLIRRIQL